MQTRPAPEFLSYQAHGLLLQQRLAESRGERCQSDRLKIDYERAVTASNRYRVNPSEVKVPP